MRLDLNPAWYNSEYAGDVRQEHADIADLFVDPTRFVEYIPFSVMALDTTLALLGVTLLRSP